jgi:uncharacterized protein YbaA (DUF1428 family)
MSYIEGFVAAVPTANKDEYVKHAKEAVAYFKKLGATRCVECWGDDVPKGVLTDFTRPPRQRMTRHLSLAGSSIPTRLRETRPTRR